MKAVKTLDKRAALVLQANQSSASRKAQDSQRDRIVSKIKRMQRAKLKMFLLLDQALMFTKKILLKCLLRHGVRTEYLALQRGGLFQKQTSLFSHLVLEVTSKLMSSENKLSLQEKSSVVALCSCQKPSVARAANLRQNKVAKLWHTMISSTQSQKMLENELSRQIILCLPSYQLRITLLWPSAQTLHVSLKNRLMNPRPSQGPVITSKRVVSHKKEVAQSNEVFMEMQQLDLQWVVQAQEPYHMQTQLLCKEALRVSTSYLKPGGLDPQKRNKLQDRHQVQAITHRRIYRSGSSAVIT